MLKKGSVEMRGEKEEERLRSPMFPRLHVNDAEKGGPRAPPRNKMALYEQLSIPSQRVRSGSPLIMPLPGNIESSLVSSMSSGHASIFERSVFTSFCNSPAPSHSENSFNPYSGGFAPSTKMPSEEQKSVSSRNDQSLSSTQPLSSSAKCNSNFKHFSLEKLGDKDDKRALSSGESRPVMHNSNSGYIKDQPYWNLRLSTQFKNISEQQKGEIGITNLQARESLSNQTFTDAFVSPSGKVLNTETLKRAYPSSYRENGRGKVDSWKRIHGVNDESDQHFVAIEGTEGHQNKSLLDYSRGTGKNNASQVTNESFSKSSPNAEKMSLNLIEGDKKTHEGRKSGPLQVVDLLLEACKDDTSSAVTITPDDVVKVLGEKKFWRARKAIVDQQRTFGLQVFELHRVMKVQKMIADLLLENNIHLRKAPSKSSTVQKAPSEHAKQQPPLIAKSTESSQKPYPIAEKNPLPVHVETNKELTQQSNHESYSPWCVPSPGNQWLIPVMSPSEGLVYKPFTAPPYGTMYFPPCGMQMMASSFSGSTVEQSSCNMSSQMSRAMTCRVGNVQASKETEIRGSTGSSLPPRPSGHSLPLFPTEPTSQTSDHNAHSNEQQTHVIKVVPRNRKLATESAARIFRSITEERKQCY